MQRRYRVNTDEIAAKVVDGEAILINLSNGIYYSLGGTGALVWALVERGHSGEEICAELGRRTKVDAETAAGDVSSLIEQFADESLIVPANDSDVGPSPLDDEFPEISSYSPPRLEKYTDMSDLLALDPPMPRIIDIPWRPPAA